MRKKVKGAFKKVGTLNIVLIFIFVFFLCFNHEMLTIFKQQGEIPQEYAISVVTLMLGECGFCGWIKTSKEKTKRYKEEQNNEEQIDE